MKINDFVKAHTLLKNQSGNEDIKETAVIISDLQGDWTITETTWEKQTRPTTNHQRAMHNNCMFSSSGYCIRNVSLSDHPFKTHDNFRPRA